MTCIDFLHRNDMNTTINVHASLLENWKILIFKNFLSVENSSKSFDFGNNISNFPMHLRTKFDI